MKSVTIDNGVKVLCLGDDRYKLARMSMHFLVPLCREDAAKNALAVRVLTRTCNKYPDFTALNRKLSMLYGAVIYSDVARLGETQVVSVSVGMIDNRYIPSGEDVAKECAELLCEMVFHPKLNEDGNAFCDYETETERRQLIEELTAEFNDKRAYARHRCEGIMFENEAYAASVDGEIDTVSKITAQELFLQWKKLLKSSRIVLTFTGMVDAEPTVAVVKKELGKIDRQPIFNTTETGKLPTEVKEITERVDVSQAKLVMGFRSSIALPDPRASAFRMMSVVYGGTPHSLLFRNVREKMSLCYYCMAQSDRKKGVMFVESGIEEKNFETAKSEILNQLQNIREGKISDEDIENAKRAVTDSFRSIEDSPSGVENWYLAQIDDEELLSPEKTAEILNRVTRDEIIEAANCLFLDTVYLLAGKEEAK